MTVLSSPLAFSTHLEPTWHFITIAIFLLTYHYKFTSPSLSQQMFPLPCPLVWNVYQLPTWSHQLSPSCESLCFVLTGYHISPFELFPNHSQILPPSYLLYNSLPNLTSQSKIPLPSPSPPGLNQKGDVFPSFQQLSQTFSHLKPEAHHSAVHLNVGGVDQQAHHHCHTLACLLCSTSVLLWNHLRRLWSPRQQTSDALICVLHHYLLTLWGMKSSLQSNNSFHQLVSGELGCGCDSRHNRKKRWHKVSNISIYWICLIITQFP